MPSFPEVLGGALPCNASSSGTTFGSGCETTTSPTEKPDDSTENHYCCRSILYVVIIGFGILTLPVIVCTRVCWIKKLRKRQQRRLDDARHRQRETHEQSIYTIAPGEFIMQFTVASHFHPIPLSVHTNVWFSQSP